jgi:hypothetical protein
MSFDGKYGDRLRKIRKAPAAAIRQLDQLRSTEPTPRETFDAEVARIAQEKLHPYGCDLVVHPLDDGVNAIPDQGPDRDEITFVATDGKHSVEPVAAVTNIVAG